MRATLLLLLSLLATVPAHAKGRTRIVHSCGCNNHFPGDPEFTVRTNWILQHGWDRGAVREALAATCDGQFGRGNYYTNCIQAPISGKELAYTEGKQRARLARERAAYRAAEAQARLDWEYNQKLTRDGLRRNGAVIDELKRRQREADIDRVLKDARDRRNR